MLEVKPDETATHYVEQIIKRRRSTRHFTDEPVSHETLLKLVEAGVYAPSGSNTQCQRFLIIPSRCHVSGCEVSENQPGTVITFSRSTPALSKLRRRVASDVRY